MAENIGSSDGHAEAMKEIVAHYLAKNDVDFAAQLADTIDDTFVRDRLLCEVAEKCGALDEDEYALQLADAIEDYGFQSVTRERIAAKKASKREFDKAFEIAETLPHPSDALAEIAVQQALSGNETEALKTVSQIEFHISKVNALQTIAAHLREIGETEKANELLSQAAAEACEIEYTEEKIRSLISIAAHFIEGGKNDRAIEILDNARAVAETLDNVHREGFLTLISLDFLRAGSVELADRTLDLVNDKTQIASCLAGFATEFEAKGERADALDALEEAYAILKSQKENEIRDSRARFSVFGSIAARFAMFEKAERAIEIALENPLESERNAALAQIARICALKEEVELSKQSLNAIEDDSARMAALISLGDAKNKQEKREEALRYLNEAESLALSVPQLSVRSEALGEIAKRFFDYGEKEKARELLTESLRAITQILDQSHKATALANLSVLFDSFGVELNETERSLLLGILRKPSW